MPRCLVAPGCAPTSRKPNMTVTPLRSAARPAALRGNTMIIVMIVLTMLGACVAASLSFTTTISRNVQRTNNYRTAIEIGDGAVDYLFTHWREKCRPTPNIHFQGDEFTDIPMPDASLFPNVKNF